MVGTGLWQSVAGWFADDGAVIRQWLIEHSQAEFLNGPIADWPLWAIIPIGLAVVIAALGVVVQVLRAPFVAGKFFVASVHKTCEHGRGGDRPVGAGDKGRLRQIEARIA
jgi:hypothetical protein